LRLTSTVINGELPRIGIGTSMKHNVEFKNFEPDQKIRKLITQLINKVDKRAKRFSPEELFLRVVIEKNPVRKLYRVSITMSMPQKTLAAKAERHELTDSLRDAFVEIERQLEAHKATLTGEYAWKRVTRRRELRKLKENNSGHPSVRAK
jgi:ribosome-associated translation inhibitor RaiA